MADDDRERRIQYLEAELRSLRSAVDAPWRAVVEDMTECIVRWRPDGTRIFVNQAYCRLFGGTREELEGTTFWPLVSEVDREHVRARIEALTPAQPVTTGVHRVLLPDGGEAWMEWTDRALFDGHGQVVELQSVGRDISTRIRLEEYARRVELADGVSRASASIAHDLANVFQVLTLVIEGQAERHPEDNEVHDADAMLAHGEALLDQLRRLRYGRPVALGRIDLVDRVMQAAPVLRYMVRATLQLRVADETDGFFVRADATQVDQILFNLVRNADEADPPAEHITIGLQLVPPSDLRDHILRGRLPDCFVVLTITDDAGGIPAELLPRIFEPHVTTKPTGQGLGLATVKGIVEAHGGSIIVRSSSAGTTFEIALPHAPGPVPREASPAC